MPSSHQARKDRLRQVPAFATRVHPAGQSYDLRQSIRIAVLSSDHSSTDVIEQFEVGTLPGLEWISTEVRNHPRREIRKTACLPLHGSVASVGPETSAGEVPLNDQQHLTAVAVLAHREARPRLPPDQQRWPGRDGDRETAFTIDISGDVRREIHETLLRARVLPRP